MIISTEAGLFGPYSKVDVDELGARLRVWPVGVEYDEPGAYLPFVVIGAYQVLDVDVPEDFAAANYTWDGAHLVPVAPAPDPS
jgi:hypothetical protein